MKTPLLILAAISVFAFSAASVSAVYLYQGWNMVSFPWDYNNITSCVSDDVKGTAVKDPSSSAIKAVIGTYAAYVTAGSDNSWATFELEELNSGKSVDTINVSKGNTKTSSSTGLSITLFNVRVAGADPATQHIEADIEMKPSDQYNTLYNVLQNWNPSTNKFDTLTLSNMYNSVIRGKGYWIYKFSSGSCSLNLKGTTINNPATSINLKAGWNLIGTPIGTVAINDFKGNCVIDSKYSPTIFDASNQKWALSNTLQNDKGYYIYVSKDCTLQKTCAAQGGTCRAWDPINGNCYSSEKEIGASECSNNLAQTRCCVPK